MSVINQMRTVHDDKHKNYFDRLQLTMQKNRTKINSAPTVKCYNEKGNIKLFILLQIPSFIHFGEFKYKLIISNFLYSQ